MIEAQNALTFAAGDRNEVVMEAATEVARARTAARR